MNVGGRECTKCSDERIKEYARKIIEKYTVNFFITGKCRRMTEALEAERQIQKGGKRMNQIQAFNFNSSEIRVVRGADGEPWFVAKDVADVLGYEKPENAVARHCRGSVTTPIQGGGFLTIIPERDVYRLIMRSKLPAAEKFEEWVVGEVLPSIRKHGAYMTSATIDELTDNPDLLIQLATKLKFEKEQRVLMEQQRDEAIRTKALIGSKREATAMATASVAKRRAEALAEKIGESVTWKAVKSIRWLLDIFAESKGMWSSVGKKLKALSDEMGYDVRTIENSDYGQVNAYHRDVIARFRAKLSADPNMLAKYRRDEMERSA